MTEYRFTVVVTTDSREHAHQVMTERIYYDENYGFEYQIDLESTEGD